MTMVFKFPVKCAYCGTEFTLSHPRMTDEFELSDSPLWPPSATKLNMQGYWVQECPTCGYVNESISEKVRGGKLVINSQKYKTVDGIETDSAAAKRFVRWAIMCHHTKNALAEMWAYVHAAWACDYAGEVETAKILRNRAIECLIHLPKRDKFEHVFWGEIKLVLLANLLRRTEQFDRVITELSTAKIKTDSIRKILSHEIELARKQEAGEYLF